MTATCGADVLNQTNLGIIGSMTSLVSDGTNLFYSTVPDLSAGGTTEQPEYIVKLPVGGGAPQTLASTTKGGPALSGFGIDDANIYYYFFETGISKLAKTGGMPTSIVTLGFQLNCGFTLDATSIFYGDELALTQVPKAGGTPTKLWSDPNVVPTNFVADADNIYFVGDPPIDVTADAGVTELSSIYRIAKTGGTPTKITQLMSDPTLGEAIWLLALDGDNLVYSTATDPFAPTVDFAIYTIPKAGGTPTKIAAAGPAFAVAGGTVYYGDRSSLKKVSEAGGAPVDLGVSTPDGVNVMALDTTNLYWERHGCIYKVAR